MTKCAAVLSTHPWVDCSQLLPNQGVVAKLVDNISHTDICTQAWY